MTHIRPQANVTYYAPIAVASRWPLIFGENWGVIVNGPSQDQGVVYSTREAAEDAFANPAVWGDGNRAYARVAALTYQGDIMQGSSGFAFATTEEMAAHDAAVTRAADNRAATRA